MHDTKQLSQANRAAMHELEQTRLAIGDAKIGLGDTQADIHSPSANGRIQKAKERIEEAMQELDLALDYELKRNERIAKGGKK